MYVYVDLYTHVCIYTSFYVYKGHRPFGSIVYNRGWLGTAAASARCESLSLGGVFDLHRSATRAAFFDILLSPGLSIYTCTVNTYI